MSNINGILSLGSRALLTQQMAIEVTGHNIANVNTPGYSRQRVNMETNEPVSSSVGQFGTGVRATEIQRIYDQFLGEQINNESQNLGRWEARKSALEKVEMIFDESSGYGLNQAMSEFWNAWQDLANNPSGHTERVILLAKSETLATTFNKTYSDLQQIQYDIDASIKGATREINLAAEQIADLNQKIRQAELNNQGANDYRDKRDLLLKELSSMIDISSSENADGTVTVSVGGKTLVENGTSRELSTSVDLQNIFIDTGSGPVEITNNILGGKLKGWLDVRDGDIPDCLNKLDTLAQSLIEEVNFVHSDGYGLDLSHEIDFFTGSLAASNMAVNSEVVGDVNKIAAAEIAGGVPGDNSNAIAIANLQNGLTHGVITIDGTDYTIDGTTFDDYYNSLVSDVGISVQEATISFDHQSTMVDQLDNYRESVSGVSIDEEMVNLVKFQHAYEAAAKLISTVDEMLDTVISMV